MDPEMDLLCPGPIWDPSESGLSRNLIEFQQKLSRIDLGIPRPGLDLG